MDQTAPVVISLRRPPGYEDVHPILVIEDAMQPEWTHEFLRDEGTAVVIAIDRPEGHERSSASGIAKDAIKPTWPSWALVRQ